MRPSDSLCGNLIFVAITALSLVAASCKSQYVGAVRAAASDDMRCPGEKIAVTTLEDTSHEHVTARTFYRAAGCGASATYVCEGWNNWDQTPICRQGSAPQ